MRLRLSSFAEELRSSFFFVPMVAVVVAIVLGFLGLEIDQRIDPGSAELPFGLSSTVDSARAVLTTIAGATITFAGIAFSISLLIIQLASSQYSPRVVHTLFRDRFNRRVMALVVGTFTYCVIVLRSVRSAIEDGGDPVIPNLSVSLAVLLGIATILAIVAFINHSAHSMDVSEILDRVRREATAHVRREWRAPNGDDPTAFTELDPDAPTALVRFDRAGWIQQLDIEGLLECLPAGGWMRLESFPGRYAIKGTPVCTVSPPPDDEDLLARRVCASVAIGDTRTMQQDASYGLRQLVDVSLKALSPGINDPTTAQDAIFHAAAVLAELLLRDPPPVERTGEEGRRVVLVQQHTHEEMISLAFDEVRRAASEQPTVCVYLLEALELLREALIAADLPDRTVALAAQARLVVAGCEEADLLAADLHLVRTAYAKRFEAAPV